MTVNVELLFCLLVYYQIKHFLADFVFQNVWMLQKSSPDWNFFLPLAIHCGVHAAATLAVVLFVNPTLWWLCIVDFVVHFAMDRVKAGPRYLGRFKDVRTRAYWVSFGIDQMVHHLTHLYICWCLATSVVS
jgi:hypothetical protein